MIAEHIQAALSTVARSFQLDASQDDTMPFIVFSLSSTPVNTKSGIASYASDLTVLCVADSIPQAVNMGNLAIAALNTMVPANHAKSVRFVSRDTSSETTDGGTMVYIESINVIVKHINP